MLKTLQIKNYVLIDSLEVSFPEGLIIITGQTGAGKSILLGALSLVLGAKADASLVGPSGENCVVEALFDADAPEMAPFLEENDIDPAGGLLIRRVVSRSGRSRSFINDCPVTLPVLSGLAPYLVDIHSQHQTRILSDPEFQLSVLDHFAGNASLLETSRSLWTRLQKLRSSLGKLRKELSTLSADREYNEAQFRQLDEARLCPGEMEELENERRVLENMEEIKETLASVSAAFSSPDGEYSMDSSLREASRRLERISRYMPSMKSLADRLDSLRLELDDISDEISSADSQTSFSEGRLREVDDRLSLIYTLLQKHSCSNVEELAVLRDEYSRKVFSTGDLEQDIAALEAEEASVVKELSGLASSLHQAREKACGPFAAEVRSMLESLEMDGVYFGVKLSAAPLCATGTDSVSFVFNASGGTPVEVSKCASGGESSRIMLSLKAMMAKYNRMPTMVFDEIDTGVSGSAADAMGSMICAMGQDMQVFAITHLPQVAAKGSAHYLVEKVPSREGRASTSIRLIEGEGRVQEVARMLSGSEVTPQAVANARALLRSI